MPAYFQLTPKGASKPEALATIDDKICAHFGEKPDEKYWHENWYDIIGFRLATGSSIEEIREYFASQRKSDVDQETINYYNKLDLILNFIETNYEVKAWHERR
jgi:hypothetical protein